MDDEDAMQLLILLRDYVTEYTPDIPQTIKALARDLADSLEDNQRKYLDSEKLYQEIVNTEGVT